MDEFLRSYLTNFIWGLSAFVVFVLLFYRLGVKQILAAVDARDAKMRRELAESEAAYAKAKQVKDEVEKQFRGVEAKITEMMAEARRDAEAHKAEIIAKGQTELDQLRQRALADIAAAKHGAIQALRAEIASVAVVVAERIITEKLDPAKHEALVSQAVAAYESANAGGR